MIRSGAIIDAKTMAALLLAQQRAQFLREESEAC